MIIAQIADEGDILTIRFTHPDSGWAVGGGGMIAAGENSILWNGEGISSGVYFYRLETDASVDTKVMFLAQ